MLWDEHKTCKVSRFCLWQELKFQDYRISSSSWSHLLTGAQDLLLLRKRQITVLWDEITFSAFKTHFIHLVLLLIESYILPVCRLLFSKVLAYAILAFWHNATCKLSSCIGLRSLSFSYSNVLTFSSPWNPENGSRLFGLMVILVFFFIKMVLSKGEKGTFPYCEGSVSSWFALELYRLSVTSFVVS